MKNGCWIPSKHPFFRVKPRFFPFPENRRIFHFLARPKAVSPLQISSSKALSSFVQERQTPCKYGVLAISTHSLSSSPNPTYPSPKTVYLRPFPSIPVYEIFGGCVQPPNLRLHRDGIRLRGPRIPVSAPIIFRPLRFGGNSKMGGYKDGEAD